MRINLLSKGSFVSAAVLFAGFTAYTYSGQAPAQRTGSPASSGSTCANSSCHSGPAISTENVTITTDIPAVGFADNTDYNITITADKGTTAAAISGFEASIENNTGHQGNLVASNSNTKLVGMSNFITHNVKQSFSGSTSAWSFKWNSGMGTPSGTTIYTAVNFANNNNMSSGDVIVTETLTLNRASAIGVDEDFIADVKIFPNPITDFVKVSFNVMGEENYNIKLYSLNGALLNVLYSNQTSGTFNQRFDMRNYAAGTYILTIESAGKVSHHKVFIQ